MNKLREWLFTLRRNLRSAGRQYLREPLMSSIAIISLAVALGAGTYLFGFVNLLLFTPPSGLPQAERLVDIGRTTQGRGFDTLSYPNYHDLVEGTTMLSDVYVYARLPVTLYGNGKTARASARLVSGSYFGALGVVPQAGRLLQPADTRAPGTGAVAVVSHRAFLEYLGGDTSRLGESIELNGVRLEIVGVLPESFKGIDIIGSAEFYVPLTLAAVIGRASEQWVDSRTAFWLSAGGRLAPGATLEQLNAELASLSSALQKAYPESSRELGLTAVFQRLLPAPARMPLTLFASLLFGLIAMVLLVAAGNVSGLLIARGEARRHEIAMRYALGARRRVIIAQLLTEVFALSLVSTPLGLLIAGWLQQLVGGMRLPIPVTLNLDVAFDSRVFGFACALSLLVTLVAGLLPALRSSSQQPLAVLSGAGGRVGNRSRFRAVMVSAQVAFTLLLLITAGLFISALQRAGNVDLGYNIDNVYVSKINLTSQQYKSDEARRRRVISDIVSRLQQQNRIDIAAAARIVPLNFSTLGYGKFELGSGKTVATDANVVSPDFFESLQIQVQGRTFSKTDGAGGERVAIVNQVLAHRLIPNGDVIGRSFAFSGEPVRVIGVVPNARHSRLDDTKVAFVYFPLSQMNEDRFNIVVRSDAGKRAVTQMIEQALHAVDPRLVMGDVRSMQTILSFSLTPQRVAGGLAAVLGALGVLLAALGLYGLLSAYVQSRTRELGVRLALGASPRRLMHAVLWRGLRLTLMGTVIGLILALLLARVLAGFLFGLDTFDAMVFVLATGLLVAISLLVLFAPARRVLRIQPQEALRHE